MAMRAATAETSGEARERILNGALEVFSERGFDGATTREIAGRAGVTLGLLQYYFGSKLKLWQAAVDLAFAELRGGLDAVLSDSGTHDERERLRLLIRGYVQFVAQNTEFIRLMHDEGKRRGPRMRWMVDRHVQPLYDRLTPQIRKAQKQGALPGGVDPVHILYVLVGAVGIIFHQAEECKRISGIDPFNATEVEAHIRAVEHFVLGPPN